MPEAVVKHQLGQAFQKGKLRAEKLFSQINKKRETLSCLPVALAIMHQRLEEVCSEL